MNDRLTALEIKITHQDQVVEDLNLLVTEQQKQIEALVLQLKKLTDQASLASQPVAMDASQEPPPPHY